MTYFDLDRLPESHQTEFERVRRDLDETCDRNAHERCRRFESAPLDMSFAAARRHVEARAEDLAQTRPECGHATNALCIVGRRSRTRGLYLDRRAFLTSYDPTQDDDDAFTLTRLLPAAVPVCGGINLEYYFSYVDNAGYGCGTKLPHNVTSLLGVMDGAASDLRTGLPWQMVEIHEPVRLLFVIETTPETMLTDHGPQPGHRPARAATAGCSWRRSVPTRTRSICSAATSSSRTSRSRPRCRALPARSTGIAAGATTWASPHRRRDFCGKGQHLLSDMPDLNILLTFLGSGVLIAPVLLVALLALPSLAGRPLPERAINSLVQITMILGLLAAVGVLALMLLGDNRHAVVDLGNWVHLHDFHFSLKFVFDRLSVPFAILSFLLCGTIGAFASRYLHREPGFNRFFVLYALFVLGMVVTSLAGTIETLFAGWELVGLSSALLVAFFQERPAPVRNGLRVWIVYRISDAALLLAAVVLHHLTGQGDFDELLGLGQPWPAGHAALSPQQALVVGLLLLVAAAGKVGPGAVLRLAAAGDGRADAVERRLLRRTVGPPGRVPAAARQPASRSSRRSCVSSSLAWA